MLEVAQGAMDTVEAPKTLKFDRKAREKVKTL